MITQVLHLKNLRTAAGRLGGKSLAILVLVLFFGVNGVRGQTFYNMSSGNYSQNFNGITTLPTNFSTVATASTGTIPVATNMTYASTASLSVVSTSTAIGIDASTSTSLVFLATGATDNTSSIAVDLNLNFTGRNAGSLGFNGGIINNGTGSRNATLRVYYSLNGTSWTEITGTNLPYTVTNNVSSSPSISVALPSALNNQSTVKLRFYYHNGTGGSSGARPKITIDNLSVSSTASTTAPQAPTIGTITPGNQQLSVAFTAGSDGGSAITSYKYSTDGGVTFLTRQTGTTGSPIVITTLSSDGTTPLSNGSSYNIQIRAVNAIGDGTPTSSTAATPYTTPSAPTINTITAGNMQLSVDFTANATGGSAITNYQYSTDGGATFLNRQTGTTGSPILITTLSSNGSTPLTNGVSYDIQIKAINAAGTGAASTTTSGTPQAPASPTITANGSLGALSTTYGSASSNASFTVAGATLSAGITVTPPVGFEVSTSSDFSSNVGNNNSPLVIGSAPTVTTTTVYVRLLATASVAGSPYSGDIVLSSSGATNVNVATTSSSVAARTLTISGLTASAKTYDGNTNVSVTGTAEFSGLQNGDAATVTGSPSFAFATASAGSAKAITQTGSYGASFTSGVIGNYSITQPTLTADINTVAITVTASNQSKNFGNVSTTTGATSFAITSGALVGSDNISTVTLAYSGSPTGDLATASAGTYTITPSAATFSVGASSNYNITYASGILTINAIAASAPTSIVITPSNVQLSVAFTAASNGGSAITTYKYSTDGGSTFLTRQTGTTASPIVITTLSSDGTTPLTNGVTYPIQIRAVTGFGDGTATSSTNGTPNIANSNVTAWINTSTTTAWHTASNWSPATVPSGAVVAQWNNTGSATGCGINLGTGIPSILALEVGNSRTRSLLLGGSAGSGSMTLNGGVINNISDVIIRNSSNSLFTIASSNGGGTLGITIANTTNNKISIENTGGITISLVIAGGSSNPLTKIGTGSGVLSLTGANTYTGLTTVTEGTLQFNKSGGTTIPNTNNVVINGGTLQVSTNQTLNDLTLTSGTLIIDPGVTLTINGTITRTSGLIRGSSTSNLVITGASGTIAFDQTTPGTTNVLRNLTISGTGTTTLGNALNITGGATPGVVTVGSGATLNTGGNLTLKSDASGTASIGNSAGTINGNVTIERYIAGGLRAHRFIGHPFTSGIALSELLDDIDITGSGNGMTPSGSNNPSAFYFDETTFTGSNNTGWVPYTTSSDLIPAKYGARVLLRGQKGQGLDGSAYTPGEVTIDMTGTVNTGQVTTSLSFTGSNGSSAGWNLISNPYPSAVSISNITFPSGVTNYYLWQSRGATRGIYHTVSKGSNTSTTNLSNADILPMGSSFFVKATSTGQAVVFNESDKINSIGAFIHKTDPFNFDFVNILVQNDTTTWDGLTIRFRSNSSEGQDEFDAEKLINPEVNFYSLSSEQKALSIQHCPFPSSPSETIKLGLKGIVEGSYRLNFSNSVLPLGYEVFLKDNFNSTTTLIEKNKVYNFQVSSDAGSTGESRFELMLKKSATGIAENNLKNLNLYPNPVENSLVISGLPTNEPISISIIDLTGREVYKIKQFDATNEIGIPVNFLSAGTYFARIQTSSSTISLPFVK